MFLIVVSVFLLSFHIFTLLTFYYCVILFHISTYFTLLNDTVNVLYEALKNLCRVIDQNRAANFLPRFSLSTVVDND